MEVVHISQSDNGNYLVTYMLTEEEFKGLQAEAQKELDTMNDTMETD